MTVLKKLSSAEAECVIERLTSWAKLELQDKDHISDEVVMMFKAEFSGRNMLLHCNCAGIYLILYTSIFSHSGHRDCIFKCLHL